MLNRWNFICFLVLAVFAFAQRPSLASHEEAVGKPYYFPGQLLVASAEIRDPRFKRSVIYMVNHDAEGAYGIVVNKIIATGPMAKLMKRFGIDSDGAAGTMALYFGGPVNPRRGFILHSNDYRDAKSHSVDGTISFTTNIALLRAVADGKGPRHVLLAIGYAGWGAGQLEDEIERGDWSLTKATEDLVFGGGPGDVWEQIIDASRVPL